MTGTRPGRKQQSEPLPVRTLERGLHLLRVLGEPSGGSGPPGLSLSELARRVDLPASTAFRLLQTLRAEGFVRCGDDGRWQVGVQAFVTGSAYLERGGPQERLIRAARPVMERLTEGTGETVNLSVLFEEQVMYLHQELGRGLLRMFTHIGARAPLHCTGAGKVLVAWRPGHRPPPGPYAAYTTHTLTSPETLGAELERTRTRGYALDDEEREVGVRCLAVPVWGRAGQPDGGRVLAALSLSAPATRLPLSQTERLADLLLRASQEISARLS